MQSTALYLTGEHPAIVEIARQVPTSGTEVRAMRGDDDKDSDW
jgi:hypothetical protein